MGISKLNRFQIDCDFCNGATCDWVTADTKKKAISILINQTEWDIINKKFKCPDCINKDANLGTEVNSEESER